jgi:enoyl-[acyl-carrier protein] reductase I
VRPLAESVGSTFIEPCDVAQDDQIEALFRRAAADLGTVDILIHAVAFAGREELSRPYYLTSRAGFLNALDISAYSLTALTRAAVPLMKNTIRLRDLMGSESDAPSTSWVCGPPGFGSIPGGGSRSWGSVPTPSRPTDPR